MWKKKTHGNQWLLRRAVIWVKRNLRKTLRLFRLYLLVHIYFFHTSTYIQECHMIKFQSKKSSFNRYKIKILCDKNHLLIPFPLQTTIPFFRFIYSKISPKEMSTLALSTLSSYPLFFSNQAFAHRTPNTIQYSVLNPCFTWLAAFDTSDRSSQKQCIPLVSGSHTLLVSLLHGLSLSTPLPVLASLPLIHGQAPGLTLLTFLLLSTELPRWYRPVSWF